MPLPLVLLVWRLVRESLSIQSVVLSPMKLLAIFDAEKKKEAFLWKDASKNTNGDEITLENNNIVFEISKGDYEGSSLLA